MAWEEVEQGLVVWHPLTFWEVELSPFPFLASEVSHLADTYKWPESLQSLLPRAGGHPPVPPGAVTMVARGEWGTGSATVLLLTSIAIFQWAAAASLHLRAP